MRNTVVDALTTLVSFQTVEGNTPEKVRALDWIQGTFLSQPNGEMQRGEIEGAPYLHLSCTHPDLLWFAHVDVVPATEKQFSLLVEGERAFGRGAKDMKGGIVPFLLAYRDITAEGKKPNVSILLTSDEETAGGSIPQLLTEGVVNTPVAFTPDTGSSPGIVTEHKGALWVELRARGTGGHAAMPWESDNAIWKLCTALNRIHDAFPPGTQDDWQVTVVPTMLRGSNARNQVPGDAACNLDIRYPPELCKEPEEALALVQAVLPAGCVLHEMVRASPLYTNADHPMVNLVRTLAKEVEEREIEIIREHGGTDARFFSEQGIPAFLYGPMGGDLHGPNEWVSIPSLLQHYKIGRKLLEKFC
ncbi:hypothetical protein COU76_02315 [Candidatus Peregrinibacteria bacterium CG10_big_fil_rev_8_21_14_0_10_49_10]|nr:MAG: hypothetical protein COU76_02315 [Candidatus Peregrinibacteria bacterium CG10_big_fil_rev_8_21_14_0_10_49_10]